MTLPPELDKARKDGNLILAVVGKLTSGGFKKAMLKVAALIAIAVIIVTVATLE